ncbi:MAG: cytochrome b/b6 domain-containing protein [bacterium]
MRRSKRMAFFAGLLLFLITPVPLLAKGSVMHPAFQLVDAGGRHVLASGNPVSTKKTCGACHDTEYIERHSYHSSVGFKEFQYPDKNFRGYPWELSSGLFGEWSPLTYRRLSAMTDTELEMGTVDWILNNAATHSGGGPAWYGRGKPLLTDYKNAADPRNPETSVADPVTGDRKGWDWQASGAVEPNCFLCHIKQPDNQARISEIEAGRFKWANTATLGQTGIVTRSADRWSWNADAFEKDGKLKADFIPVQEPKTANCSLCHHMANPAAIHGSGPGIDGLPASPTGVVFAPGPISESPLNLTGKQNLTRSWDIHAERLLNCNGCHYSINNPAFYQESNRTRPVHLKLDGRKMSISEFLHRPTHKLANMRIRQEIQHSEPDNVIHRCESCHDPYTGHEFLPYKKRHIWALGCESCHIPRLFAPALQQIDWTVLASRGEPVKKMRGSPDAAQGTAGGYEPAWLTRNLADKSCLLPYNLVTSSFWTGGEPVRPVQQSILNDVYFDGTSYRPEIVAGLDQNANGTLEEAELRLDTAEKTDLIRSKLQALGVVKPEIVSEIRPYSVHHGVTGRKGAIRACYDCHGSNSRFTQSITLASFIPGQAEPKLAPNSFIKLEGAVERTMNGGLVFHPRPKERGLYLFGRYRNTWVDIVGLLAILGVVFGIILHGGLRILAARRIKPHVAEYSTEYMYPVYERLWHWLQAATVILFIFTGLEIHFADKLIMLGYETAVRIHEITAFVFLGNAFLSFAYHITAGEIKTYLPQPKSFIDESWKQAIYYLKGIFQGAEHPIEKTPKRRLNPLQQVTYLMILYVLIPVQGLSGILIWGAEYWPSFLETLGGLSVIAPIHTLCAWFFISFLIMHIYLTTTGHTPLANIIAMFTGWEDVEIKKQ